MALADTRLLIDRVRMVVPDASDDDVADLLATAEELSLRSPYSFDESLDALLRVMVAFDEVPDVVVSGPSWWRVRVDAVAFFDELVRGLRLDRFVAWLARRLGGTGRG